MRQQSHVSEDMMMSVFALTCTSDGPATRPHYEFIRHRCAGFRPR
jgi:hypothetical protein